VHNSDNKGLGSIRNIESTLSRLEIVGNANRVTNVREHSNFRHGYNLGKESVSKEEIIFVDILKIENLDSYYIDDIKTIEDDIADSREVEFTKSKYASING
jgi:hypothetical protein